MITLTFFGTSYAIPTAKRSHTAILLNYKNENILVDCGEGTQRQFRKAKLNPCKLTRILITHWHGDHVLGIPGLLQTLSLSGYNKTLFIYGPKGIKKFIENILKTFVFHLNFKIKIEETNKKRFFETDDFYFEAEKMTHGIICNSYVFVKKGLRRIDKKKLKKFKLPEGKFLRDLKKGKNILYKGKKYFSKDLTFEENDKKVSFVLDTSLNSKIVGFVENSDLLICGATFHSELESEAQKKKHLTAKQAGEIAKKSKSKKLLLTHISQRYEKNLKRFLGDAKKVFKNSYLVEDFDVVEIK
tara:strand:+ start:1131 stop:2030 length:900 start_codon:yes stop_codon:yes gene_type:complete